MAFVRKPEFDPSRDFVCGTFFRAGGVAHERGAPFPKDLVDTRTLRLLYDAHKIAFADASDQEQVASLHPVTLSEGKGGWWTVSAPWLDDPVKVQGEEKAKAAALDLKAAGEPLDHHGVLIIEAEPGVFRVNAKWSGEPETFDSFDAAYARATELRAAGEPAGDEDDGDVDDADARIKALVDSNSREDLDKLAEGLEGVETAGNKTEVAKLIVAAGRDKVGDGGAA